MAKQLINVGSQANDGTGDTIRSGAQKVNSSINEIYNNLGDGTDLQVSISTVTTGNVLRSNGTQFVSAQLDYSDLSGKPTIPAAQLQSDWNAEEGVTQILNKPTLFTGVYADLTGKPELSSVATSGDYLDLINTPTLSEVATSGNYEELINLPSLFSGNYNDLTNTPSLSEVATSGDYLDLSNRPTLSAVATSGDYEELINLPSLFSGNYNDLTNKPDILLSSRTTISGTTSSIADAASENLDLTGFKSYAVLKVSTSLAALVTIYTDQTSRTNDATRDGQQDPAVPGSGVVAEVITTGEETVLVSPGSIGYNNDAVTSNYIYMKVKNLSGDTSAIDVTLTLLQLEL